MKFYQSIFNFNGEYVKGQTRSTIADWLNDLSRLHGVITNVSITVLGQGLLVLVMTQEPDIEVQSVLCNNCCEREVRDAEIQK